jgi:3-oxoacyl-[acyl-carrier protein] reductase
MRDLTKPPSSIISLQGKVALVTGGSRGIGAAVARCLAKAGARVAVTYMTRRSDAESTADSIARMGGECMILKANGARGEDVRRAVGAVRRRFRGVDILVNNAGIWKRRAIVSMTERQWDETLDANLKSVFLYCKAAAPLMKRRGGVIINIASTAGQRGEPFYSHYAASKGGVIALTKSIAAELAPKNIRVNCVAPGWVDTEMTANVLRKARRSIEASIPRGNVAAPEDIAGAVLFLASDLSRHIVGATINVNGGGVLVG